jgi:hypothetical protein
LNGSAGSTGAGLGAHVIPRPDGTFLIIHGAGVTNTDIYEPWGGLFGVGVSIGAMVGGPVMATAVGPGALSFQRPDGKWVTLVGNASATSASTPNVNLVDAGWYSDGQYLSEQMKVPALSANSTIDWKQTPDNYVRVEVRAASSQAALGVTGYTSIGKPGQSMYNAGGETWVQVEINMRRDFPTFGGALNGVYNSGGGLVYLYRTVATPTVTQYDINNGQDLLNLQTDGQSVLRVDTSGNIYSSAQGGFYSGGADLAENYTSTQSLMPGEVVSVDPGNAEGVLRTTRPYQEDMLGIVSTDPGFVAGSRTADSYPIALVGRVPVNVSTENGMIHIGDYLTAASVSGYAMKATLSGRVVGKALENLDPGTLTSCPGDADNATRKCGSVIVFANLIDFSGESVDDAMSDYASTHAVFIDTSSNGFSSTTASTTTSLLSGTHEGDILSFLESLRDDRAQTTSFKSEVFTDKVSAVSQIIAPNIFSRMLTSDNIQGLKISTDKLVANGLIVNSIGLDGSSTDMFGDINFFGRPYFTTDTAGSAVIKQGSKTVDVVFDRDYIETPIVSATIALESASSSPELEQSIFDQDIRFIVSRKNVHGFTIILNKPAPGNMGFSWTALAVKNSKLFTSKDQNASTTPLTTNTAETSTSTPTTKISNSTPTLTSTTTDSTFSSSTPPTVSTPPVINQSTTTLPIVNPSVENNNSSSIPPAVSISTSTPTDVPLSTNSTTTSP